MGPYLPLPMDGKAMDFSFLSSARAKQFFTVFSRSSSHLSAPQMGLLQWITNLAGRPWPALTAAGGDETETVSWVPLQSTRAKCQAQAGSPAPVRLPGPTDHLVQEGCSCLLPCDSHGSSSWKLLVLQSPPSVAGQGGHQANLHPWKVGDRTHGHQEL